MAINNLSVGRDFTINIHSATAEINLDTVTNFRWDSNTDVRTSIAVDGSILYAPLPMGYTGSFDLDRTSPALEEYWQSYEDAYYNGDNLLSNTITITIQEATGGVSQYEISGVMFDNPSYGSWAGDNIVSQTISFRAFRVKKIV